MGKFADSTWDMMAIKPPKPKSKYGMRVDGTPKAEGFFGLVPMADGSGRKMSEKSASMGFGPKGNSREVLLPLIVPTLTRAELDILASGKQVTKDMYRKAADHAKQRMREGKSPFWEQGDPVYPMPSR